MHTMDNEADSYLRYVSIKKRFQSMNFEYTRIRINIETLYIRSLQFFCILIYNDISLIII